MATRIQPLRRCKKVDPLEELAPLKRKYESDLAAHNLSDHVGHLASGALGQCSLSGMAELQFNVPKEAIDELFSEWDPDGSGALERY